MLPALWPLFRAQCVRAGRINRNTGLHNRRFLSSTPHVQHRTASLSFSRLSHSTVNSTQTVDAPARDFPIDVIEKQQSLRRFATLIEDGKQDEASRALTEFLEAQPAEGDLDAFRHLKDIIAPAGSENPRINFLVQLGSAAASRGYADFARSEILPLVSQFGTLELFSQLEHELTTAEHATRPNLSDKQVFEQTSDDYTAMQALATVAMPSIQDLVEQQLPALLPEPVTEDASIFEDGAGEDLFYQPADHLAHSEHLSTGFLDKLLAEGNYEQAYQFLKEMRDLGTDAPFSPKYGEVAWHIVRDSPHLSSQLAEQFLTWLTLIPPSEKLVHRPLRQITGRLLDVEIPNTLLLKRVALIYASKGFILQTGNMLNLIVRNTKPIPLKKFVDEFEAAYRDYWVQSTPHRLEDSIATITYVRNNILRTLAASGRHREIKTFLPLSGEYQLWPSTYAFLLHYPKSAEVKERMRSMLEGLENHDEAAMLEVKERRLGRPIDFGDNLVAGMRYLKNALASQTELPHPITIVDFMNKYLSSGRSTGLQMIFNRAHQSNLAVSRTFILAEMLFYRRLQHYDLVMETFVDHFYLVGVSREHVLNHYNQIIAKRMNYERRIGRDPPLTRFYVPSGKKSRGRKLWPMTLHCIPVWDALVATSASHDVEHLYARFLRLAHDRDYEQQRNDETADGKAPFKVPMAQASSFTPFLRPMMAANGPEAGVRIMRDILDLRLLPHTYIYTELAGFYARRGNVDKTFEIIDQLESRKKFNHRPPTGPPMRVRVPPPDLPFYVSVLRGLLISRNVEAAEEVVRRLFKMYTYVRRENYLLDAALADLKELKKVNNAWTRVDVSRRSQPAHVDM